MTVTAPSAVSHNANNEKLSQSMENAYSVNHLPSFLKVVENVFLLNAMRDKRFYQMALAKPALKTRSSQVTRNLASFHPASQTNSLKMMDLALGVSHTPQLLKIVLDVKLQNVDLVNLSLQLELALTASHIHFQMKPNFNALNQYANHVKRLLLQDDASSVKIIK